VGAGPVDIDFTEHIKGGSFGSCKLLDFSVGSRFLTTELVAREGKDPQTVSFSILFVKRFQLLVVHGSLASLRGDVDDDADVALVLAEADVVAVDVLGRKLVDCRRLRRVGGISGRHDGEEVGNFADVDLVVAVKKGGGVAA